MASDGYLPDLPSFSLLAPSPMIYLSAIRATIHRAVILRICSRAQVPITTTTCRRKVAVQLETRMLHGYIQKGTLVVSDTATQNLRMPVLGTFERDMPKVVSDCENLQLSTRSI